MTQRYQAIDFFGIRVAAFPVSTLNDWAQAKNSISPATWLAEQFQQPYLREALWVASPALADRWSSVDWMSQPMDADWLATLAKYLSRACFRSTPFGLFAGVGAGAVNGCTKLIIENRYQWTRRVRLDHAYLTAQTAKALAKVQTEPWMPYIVNSTMHLLHDAVRFFVSEGTDKDHAYRHIQIELSAPLECVLTSCRTACPYGCLVEQLQKSFPEADLGQLKGFLDGLIARGLIVSALSPPLTSLSALTEFLCRFPDCSARKELERIEHALSLSNGSRIEQAHRSVLMTADAVRKIDSDVSTHFLQIDSEIQATSLSLSKTDITAISDAIDALWLLSQDETVDPVESHVSRFTDRWGDALVPLALVADEDAGLGFGKVGSGMPEFLRQLDLRANPVRQNPLASNNDRWLLRRVMQALDANEEELVFSNADLKSLRPADSDDTELPRSLSVMLSFYESTERPDAPTLWIEKVSNSTTALLGRFCATSKSIHDAVLRIVDKEQHACQDAILAEIVHLPRPRLGNIASRPVLRAYEIPYAGVSGAQEDRQLALDDLFVGVTRQRRFFLWSSRLQRRIIPVLSCAHNFSLENGMSVYRLLCSISTHGTQSIAPLLPNVTFLPRIPRIRFGRCVLRVACWHLDEAQFDSLKSRFRVVGTIDDEIKRRGIPRLTTYGSGDRVLILDSINPILIQCFLDAKHRFPIALQEASPAQQPSLCLDKDGQRYRHEIVLPMLRTESKSASLPDLKNQIEDYRHTHIPGGVWLSLKIYTGTQTAERLLSEHLQTIVAKHAELTNRQPWFFVRYTDPDHHLRVRFSGSHNALFSGILPAVHDVIAPLVSAGLATRLQIDTYVPELSRYGGRLAMPIVEHLFHADSEMHIHAIRSGILYDPQARLLFAVESICRLLIDFGFDDKAQRDLLARLAKAMIDEFGGSLRLKKQIGQQYRQFRGALESERPDAMTRLTSTRSKQHQAQISELRNLEKQSILSTSLDSIAASLMHMSLNRLFISHARQQEMLVYEFARRLVTSSVERHRS